MYSSGDGVAMIMYGGGGVKYKLNQVFECYRYLFYIKSTFIMGKM